MFVELKHKGLLAAILLMLIKQFISYLNPLTSGDNLCLA